MKRSDVPGTMCRELLLQIPSSPRGRNVVQVSKDG
jgi:hypothetical protein